MTPSPTMTPMTKTTPPLHAAPSFAFDRFLLAPERQLLLKDDVAVRIGGRALDLLTALVERAGEVVSKRDLMERVWPSVVVEECNLKVNMGVLRKALGDDVGAARFIATVTGRGYRFVAPVRILTSTATSLATVDAPAPRNHNLPFGIARVFGRSDAIEMVGRDLEDVRLVSLVGPGGIGKTTVALAVAETLIDAYRDGVWLVDLSPLEDAALVASAIATVVGITADSPNVLATLCEYLRDRQTLIVLDSCEHLVSEAAHCAAALLATAPSLHILTTTREHLGLEGERVRRLDGLAAPPAWPDLDAGQALTFSAVQLFVDRATDRLESFSLSDGDAQAVAGICRKLDGHALAIELAATRVAAFGARGVLEQLDEHLGMGLQRRGGPARHRTLMAMIEWSYRLLTETERSIMQRLSTFAGAFSLEDACAVAGSEKISRAYVLEGLASLVDKSLIGVDIGQDTVGYRLWDTTRSYALTRLVASGDRDEVRRRHAEYILVAAEQATLDARQITPAEWTSRDAHLLDEIRSASRWAFATPGSAQLGIQLTIAAIPLWKRLSLAEECRAAASRALEDRFAAHRSAAEEMILQQTLAATLLNIQGTLPEVKTALEAALAIAVSLGDTARQLECLRGLSGYELWTGDSGAVLALSDRMRAITGEEGEAATISADIGTGSALEWLGDLDGARRHLDKALNRKRHDYSRFGDEQFAFNQQLLAQVSMVHVQWLQGFADQARATARRMVAEAEASNYAWSYCFARFQSATLSLHLRDYDTSKRLMDEGMDHAAKHGITFWRGSVQAGQYARWRLYKGQLVDLAEMRLVLASMRERGSRMYYPHLLTNYGEAVARQSDLQEGLTAIDEAIALCEVTGQIVVIPEVQRIKGNVIRWQDPSNWRRAADCFRQSIDQACRDGALAWQIRSAISLVKLMRAHGGDEEAEKCLETAYSRFTEGFDAGDLVRARTLLDTR